jgi:transposase
MSIGKRRETRQQELWVPTVDLTRSPGHPFYERVNRLLGGAGFDAFVEARCAKFYADKMGRPSLAPGVYVRMLLVGYFESLDSERGIAWRCADSLALRNFLGLTLSESPADHSTVSRTRRLIDLETHAEIFGFVLKLLAEHSLISGKTIGIDATTLEANAAMKSIVRRDDGQGYQDFLTALAKESGIETPTREDLARIDRKRERKGSNDDWVNPHDPDAQITKMKDGSTHLAHKAEHAVDMDSGAVLAVTIQPGATGDTTSVYETLSAATENIVALLQDAKVAEKISPEACAEFVADKGYHSNDTISALATMNTRSYISEPKRGCRQWHGENKTRDAVYANRRRMNGERGKSLMRRRGEYLERPFAHCLESGGMRRVHLRRCANIAKRYLVHVAACNLGLLMRTLFGNGTPRGSRGRTAAAAALAAACDRITTASRPLVSHLARLQTRFLQPASIRVAA